MKFLIVTTLLLVAGINSISGVAGRRIKRATTTSSTFQTEALNQHNFYRTKHGTPLLTLNSTTSAVSQEWANYLAANDQFQHRPNSPYGENLYWISGGALNGQMPVDSWYNEIKDYDYSNPGFSSSTGHFTQVVWVNSKSLGIGMAKSASGGTYVVANYYPPGNYLGQFEQNVRRPV